MDKIYSARDVQVFCVKVADGKIRFCYIYFFKKKIDVLILIYLTNNNFLLQIMVLRREPKPVDRFIETHM